VLDCGSAVPLAGADPPRRRAFPAGPISNYQGGEAKGLGVKFKQRPWYIGVDWIDINANRIGSGTLFVANAKIHNDSGWQIAGRYQAKDWSVAAFYDDVKNLGLDTNTYLNSTYKLGKTTLIATYGQNRDATQFFNRDIDTWSLGAKYALTKDLELFAAWVDRFEDAFGTTAAKNYQIFTLGINAKFGY